MIVSSQKRPRDLGWHYAGPLLFGDWGTSRLYVLGLAFYFVGSAAPIYLAAMSVVLIAVAWAYTIVCRAFPDGGGVYAAARQLSPTLSVIGATLLLCGYLVTATLSIVEALRYFGLDNKVAIVALSAACIAVIGVINWFGARSAGRFALVVAVAAIALSVAVAAMCIPLLGTGLSNTTTGHAAISDPWERWVGLIRIILALSGVECVANMTGVMREPVDKTAKKTIWPVLIEVVLFNMLFGIALCALPSLTAAAPIASDAAIAPIVAPAGPALPHHLEYGDNPPQWVEDYRDHAMKVLTEHAATPFIGAGGAKALSVVAGIIFGLLLISAANTAVMALVSVQYAMGQDKELPAPATKLNYSGVPWVGLVLGCIAPVVLLLIVGPDIKLLAELYAVGVVGAIAINLVSCAVNRHLKVNRWERAGLWTIGIVMCLAELTIMVAKPASTVFAGVMIFIVLGSRAVARAAAARKAASHLPEPALGWLAEVRTAPATIDPSRPRIMLAARGRYQAEFAVDMARQRGATLFAVYVRTLRVLDLRPGAVPRVEDDRDAQEALGSVALLARQYRVPFIPIYVQSASIAEEILDYTVTYGCDTLIMGKSRRRMFARKLEGDVVGEIAQHLPDGVALITREATPHPMRPPPTEPGGPLA
jgi:amino acid transporter/nucleotide-binding universal stress UspA family protein